MTAQKMAENGAKNAKKLMDCAETEEQRQLAESMYEAFLSLLRRLEKDGVERIE